MENITTPPSLWSALPATKLPTPSIKTNTISVTHMHVRESMSFVIFKLILVEWIAATAVILFHILFLSRIATPQNIGIVQQYFLLLMSFFVIIVAVKTVLMLRIILQWLYEYYEITPTKLIHKKGLLFKKEEEYVFSHLMSIDQQQTILGRLLNYGNIHLYDRYINQNIYMSFIHNPHKYYLILKSLIPYTDSAQSTIRSQLTSDDQDDA